MVREQVVRRLMNSVNDHMTTIAEGTSANEVVSAYMTLARNAALVAKEMGADVRSLRAGLEKILLELDDPNARVM